MMRLDKALSVYTTYTRSQLKKMIAAGEVTLDGVPALRPDQKILCGSQHLFVRGEEVYTAPAYLMLNKPQGYVSATDDKHSRTVLELVPPALMRKNLFPAGRLDKDTEGFVLLTDDGDFAHRILSPKKHVPKEYLAHVRGRVDEKTVERFSQGVVLEDGTVCAPAGLSILEAGDVSVVRVTLYQGMYHQIKRMCMCCGGEVIYLRREKIGGLALDENLPLGGCRALVPEEVCLILGKCSKE